MLKFTKEKKRYFDKYTSTNAASGKVIILDDGKDFCQAGVYHDDGNFTIKVMDNFEVAKNWAETQICQVVTITKKEANKLASLGIN